jgi:hypothetical protein
MGEPLIAATVIGSWSFPGWYEKFIGDVGSHPDLFGPVDRENAVRDAVRLAIDDQLRSGLDRISDGEMHSRSISTSAFTSTWAVCLPSLLRNRRGQGRRAGRVPGAGCPCGTRADRP